MPKAPCPQLYHVLLLIMKFASFFYSLLLVIAFSGASFAQTAPFDGAAFENLAERTESVLSNTTTSTESLDILRSELLLYRAETFAQQGKLIDQLAEIETALDELGDPPADDATPEPESIAQQRNALNAEHAKVQEPYLVLRQSYRRADILIKQIDQLKSDQKQARLYTRGETPLAPRNIIQAGRALLAYFNGLRTEMLRDISNPISNQNRWNSAFEITMFLILGLGMMVLAPIILSRNIANNFARPSGRRKSMEGLVLSLLLLVVPIMGAITLSNIVDLLGIFLIRGAPIIEIIQDVGFSIAPMFWLARYLFFADSPLAMRLDDGAMRHRMLRSFRVVLLGIAVVYALGIFVMVVESSEDWTPQITSVLFFPLIVAMSMLLWQIGTGMRQYYALTYAAEAQENAMDSAPKETFLPFIFTTFIAVLPLVAIGLIAAAAIGYTNLAQFVVAGIVTSLMLIGGVYVVFYLLTDIIDSFYMGGLAEVETDADAPVRKGGLYRSVLGLVLILASLPFHALAWGSQSSDLLDMWRLLQDGFIVGDMQFSSWDMASFVLIFTVGYIVTRLLQATLRNNILPNTRIEVGAQNAIVTGLGYTGIFLAAVIAITSTGLDLSNLAIVAGALSVGIGFGLQTVVSNFVSGIILLIERPIKLGDWVEVGAYSGNVRKISVRSTEIETFDRASIIVPNADLIGGVVTNWTHANNYGRVIIPIGVGYDSDVHHVRDVLMEVVKANDLVLKRPEPTVLFMRFGADALEFEVRAILKDVNTVITATSDLNYAIAGRFREEGIEIPFAQRDVTIKNPEVLAGIVAKSGKSVKKSAKKK